MSQSIPSGSDNPIENEQIKDEESSGGKRGVADTSFEQSNSLSSSSPASKRSNIERLPVPDDPTAVVTQEYLVSTLNALFCRFESKLDSRFDKLNSRLHSLELKLLNLEEEASSRDIRVENSLSRVDALENKAVDFEQRLARLESVDSPEEWQPVGTPETKVLLLGDSNSGGKIKFGSEQGTLGRALPGSDQYCPKFEDLPNLDSPLLQNVSDVVLAVGTNNLKIFSCDPEELVKNTYSYVKAVTHNNPALHVLVPGVLPVHGAFEDTALNSKIKVYNHYLKDMCNNLNKVSYLDVNVFSGADGSLKPHLSKGGSDPLHLSEQGIRLFASRIKYALRSRHNLPVNLVKRVQSASVAHPSGASSMQGQPQRWVPPARGSNRGRPGYTRGTGR